MTDAHVRDVESNLAPSIGRVLQQEGGGGATQVQPLARRHGLPAIAEGMARARLHLAHHQEALAFDDEVEFADAASPVAGDLTEAARAVVIEGSILTPTPEIESVDAGCHEPTLATGSDTVAR